MNGNEANPNFEESIPQSFIIKIQQQEDGIPSNSAQWHIEIIHVMSGKQVILKSFEQIKTFIWPFLEELEISSQPDWLKTE